MNFNTKMPLVLLMILVATQQLSALTTQASGPSLAPITFGDSSASLSLGPTPTASSSLSSGDNSSSASSGQSLGQSANASNASSNASLSLPGFPVQKIPGQPVAVSAAQEDFIRLASGWIVSFSYKIFDSNKPTLLLMPGIFRGQEKEEESLRSLEGLKVNYVSIHFSTHNKSILYLEKNEVPHFAGGEPHLSSAKFAQEVEAVYRYLKIKKPIVVALSYSATVVPYLNSAHFPYVVEMVPMGRYDETNLIGMAMQRSWEDLANLNPFLGQDYVDKVKNQNYHFAWNPVVNFLTSQIPSLSDPLVFNKQLDAFVAMTFASENFDITKTNFNNGFKMAWIVAESEDPTRAYYQSIAIKKYLASLDSKTKDQSIFGAKGVMIIKNSSHIIPQDQPGLYASALKLVVDQVEKEKSYK